MLDQATIAVIKSTIPLLESAGPDLTRHFYQRMFSHNPELKDLFNLAHQRSGGQPLALFSAVAAYVHIPADHEHRFRFNVNTISGPM